MAIPTAPLDPRAVILLDGIAKDRKQTRKDVVSSVINGHISRERLVYYMLEFWICPFGGPASVLSMAGAHALTLFLDALKVSDKAAEAYVPEILEGLPMIYRALTIPFGEMTTTAVGKRVSRTIRVSDADQAVLLNRTYPIDLRGETPGPMIEWLLLGFNAPKASRAGIIPPNSPGWAATTVINALAEAEVALDRMGYDDVRRQAAMAREYVRYYRDYFYGNDTVCFLRDVSDNLPMRATMAVAEEPPAPSTAVIF